MAPLGVGSASGAGGEPLPPLVLKHPKGAGGQADPAPRIEEYRKRLVAPYALLVEYYAP